jgi:hypothetical protein
VVAAAAEVGAAAVAASAVDDAAASGTRDKVATTGKVGAPDKTAEPQKGDSKKPASRFVGTVTASTVGDAGAKGTPEGEKRDQLTPPAPPARRHRRVSGRFVILLVVLVLVLGAAGGWYYKRHHSSTGRPAVPTAQQTQKDVALAAKAGIQAGDLTGWTVSPGSPGDGFAPVGITSAAATAAQGKASTALAQCLKVPEADVTRAFGAASTARTASSLTPTYVAPGAPGTTASSVVDVMRGPVAEHADNKIFSNPTNFAVCYEFYADSMLPYAGTAAAPFTSVAVKPATVAAPSNPKVTASAFTITRIGGGVTDTSTVVAVFGGRVQDTLDMASTSTFPAATETTLLTAIEARVVGDLRK